MAKSSAVLQPNLGLYLNDPGQTIPARGLKDGFNFRITEGVLHNEEIGWEEFVIANLANLNGPVLKVYGTFERDGTEHLLFFTETDIYEYDLGTADVRYITPIYATGTASASGTAVTGIGTLWDTIANSRVNARPGDEISFGAAAEDDPTATWFTILSVETDTGLTLTASAGIIGAGAYTIRQKFATEFDPDNENWSVDTFILASDENGDVIGDVVYATNGIDPIVAYYMATEDRFRISVLLSVLLARRLKVWQNMLLLGSITPDGEEFKPGNIRNSNPGQPEVIDGTGLSGEYRTHGGSAPITNLRPLGESLVIYATGTNKSNIVLTQFVGDPFVLTFREVVVASGTPGDHGPLAGSLVLEMGDHHMYLGEDDQYRFDGTTIVPVGQHYWPAILPLVDHSRLRVAGVYDIGQKNEAVWAIPLTTDIVLDRPFKAHVAHYREHPDTRIPIPMSQREFPFISVGFSHMQETLIWSDASMNWNSAPAAALEWGNPDDFLDAPRVLAGDMDGKVWRLYRGSLKDGDPFDCHVEFGRRTISISNYVRALIKRVYPFAVNPTLAGGILEVICKTYNHQTEQEAVTHGPFPYDLSLVEGRHFVSPFVRGRGYSVRFQSASTTLWNIEGYDVEMVGGGKR